MSQADYDRAVPVFRAVGKNFLKAAETLGVDWRTTKNLWENGIRSGIGANRKSWPTAPPIKDVIAEETRIKVEASQIERRRILEEEARVRVGEEMRAEAEQHENEILRLGRLTVRAGLLTAVRAAPVLQALANHIRETYCEEVVGFDGSKELKVRTDAAISMKDLNGFMEKLGMFTTRLTFAGKMLRELGKSERDAHKQKGADITEMSPEQLQEEAAALVPFFARLSSGETGSVGGASSLPGVDKSN